MKPPALPPGRSRLKGIRDRLFRRAYVRAESPLDRAIGELIPNEDAAKITIDPDQRVLLENVLAVRNVAVVDIMVPRADIVAVEAESTLKEVAALMSSEAHSRLPVYRKTLDDVIGIVHIKEILDSWISQAPFHLSKIDRPALFVAPTMRVLDLLLQMRSAHTHMALVVDEYGGVNGLVTIEDLVEEIIGEIQDEHDVETPPMLAALQDGSLLADARVELETFEARIGRRLLVDEDEDIDTLGGLVFYLAGRVPARGEIIHHPSGIEFEILEADARRIRRLRVRNLSATLPPTDE
ncbi:MAG: hemolysin family protein [Pseudomonadota bacterium]